MQMRFKMISFQANMLWTIALMGFPNNILIAFELISINRQVKMQLLTVSHLDLIRWIIKESKGKQNYLKKKCSTHTIFTILI